MCYISALVWCRFISSNPTIGKILRYRWMYVTPRSYVPVFDRRQLSLRARAQLGTLIISPVLTGRSKDQECCDQAVVHAQ
jgi:hypothetical protein